MGQGTWMGWLVSTIHDLLKIIEKILRSKSFRLRESIREQPQRRQGRPLIGRTKPAAKLGAGLLQKCLQLRVQAIGRSEGGQWVQRF